MRPSDGDDCPTIVHFDNWRSGDSGALAGLQARFKPLLQLRVRRQTAWPALKRFCDIEDVLQEIWISADASLKKGNFTHAGPGSGYAWLGTIADRRCVDLVRHYTARKRGDRAPRSIDTAFDIPDQAVPGRSAPVSPTSNARESEFLRTAQKVMTEDEWVAWDLVEIQGYSFAEAGLAMSRSPSTVHSLFHHGKSKLMRALAGENPGN